MSANRAPLHQAIIDNNIDALRAAISAGEDINALDLDETPLMLAARRQNFEMVDYLLKHAALIDKHNAFGENVLHCLVRSQGEDVVQADDIFTQIFNLLNRAHPIVRLNGLGLSHYPLDLAILSNNVTLYQFLINYGFLSAYQSLLDGKEWAEKRKCLAEEIEKTTNIHLTVASFKDKFNFLLAGKRVKNIKLRTDPLGLHKVKTDGCANVTTENDKGVPTLTSLAIKALSQQIFTADIAGIVEAMRVQHTAGENFKANEVDLFLCNVALYFAFHTNQQYVLRMLQRVSEISAKEFIQLSRDQNIAMFHENINQPEMAKYIKDFNSTFAFLKSTGSYNSLENRLAIYNLSDVYKDYNVCQQALTEGRYLSQQIDTFLQLLMQYADAKIPLFVKLATLKHSIYLVYEHDKALWLMLNAENGLVEGLSAARAAEMIYYYFAPAASRKSNAPIMFRSQLYFLTPSKQIEILQQPQFIEVSQALFNSFIHSLENDEQFQGLHQLNFNQLSYEDKKCLLQLAVINGDLLFLKKISQNFTQSIQYLLSQEIKDLALHYDQSQFLPVIEKLQHAHVYRDLRFLVKEERTRKIWVASSAVILLALIGFGLDFILKNKSKFNEKENTIFLYLPEFLVMFSLVIACCMGAAVMSVVKKLLDKIYNKLASEQQQNLHAFKEEMKVLMDRWGDEFALAHPLKSISHQNAEVYYLPSTHSKKSGYDNRLFVSQQKSDTIIEIPSALTEETPLLAKRF